MTVYKLHASKSAVIVIPGHLILIFSFIRRYYNDRLLYVVPRDTQIHQV